MNEPPEDCANCIGANVHASVTWRQQRDRVTLIDYYDDLSPAHVFPHIGD